MGKTNTWLQVVVEKIAEAIPAQNISWLCERLSGFWMRLQLTEVTLQMLAPEDRARSACLVDAVHTVAELMRDARKVEEVRPEDIPRVLAVIAALESALAARLMAVGPSTRAGDRPVEDDRLLTAAEAAALLRVTPRWLYRRAGLPRARVRPAWEWPGSTGAGSPGPTRSAARDSTPS